MILSTLLYNQYQSYSNSNSKMREMSKLFLNCQIHKDNQSKTIELTQPALIEPVIKDIGYWQL